MNLQGFLQHLLSSTTSQSGPGRAASGPGSLLNADFGKGAISGGALGLLLGKNRGTRKLATYGGLAAIGVMAYKAYGDYSRQQGAAATPQTVDRLPAPEAALHGEAILRAIVAAAKADGHVDAREREVIEGEFARMGTDTDVQRWLHEELAKPLDPVDVARAATSPEIASEMYLASLMVAEEQGYMERAYLDELARQLKIDAALKLRLEQELAQR